MKRIKKRSEFTFFGLSSVKTIKNRVKSFTSDLALSSALLNSIDCILKVMESRTRQGKQVFLSQLGAIIAAIMMALTWVKRISPPD